MHGRVISNNVIELTSASILNIVVPLHNTLDLGFVCLHMWTVSAWCTVSFSPWLVPYRVLEGCMK
jgi:hypothetical protein